MCRLRSRGLSLTAAALLLALLPLAAFGDEKTDAHRAAVKAAGAAARDALLSGPTSVALRDQATLALPEHYGFVPRKQAADLMNAMGNRTGDDFLGLVVPLGESDGDWFVTVDYQSSGYIKDDDAQHWDADKLLKSLKDNTEAGNEERARIGAPPIVVTRWVEPPAYTQASHELVWAAEVQHKDGQGEDPFVNYNT